METSTRSNTLQKLSEVVGNEEHNHYKGTLLIRANMDDGVPESLKAILWNRYAHWSMANPEGFKRWYLKYYLNNEESRSTR